MAKSSWARGFAGLICGVIVALLAIFIGATTVRLSGGESPSHGSSEK